MRCVLLLLHVRAALRERERGGGERALGRISGGGEGERDPLERILFLHPAYSLLNETAHPSCTQTQNGRFHAASRKKEATAAEEQEERRSFLRKENWQREREEIFSFSSSFFYFLAPLTRQLTSFLSFFSLKRGFLTTTTIAARPMRE